MIGLITLITATAHAFCGTYVGGAGASLTNVDSQIVVVRDGTRTTLTLASDVSGDVEDFAMIVPVPAVLGEGDIRTVDPAVLDRIDTYGSARLVAYTCDSLHGWGRGRRGGGHGGGSRGCGGGGCTSPAGDTADSGYGGFSDEATSEQEAPFPSVEVEAEYTVGAYDIVVLSAEDATDLLGWLDAREYSVSADAEAMLQEYLDQGVYFFAARVSLDAMPEGTFLEPLQFSYESEVMALPIRLGTLNADGPQDVVVHVINDFFDGRAGISNYPEFQVTDECMWAEEGAETFGDFVGRMFDAGFDASGHGAAWAVEHAWGPEKCDPCTDVGMLDEMDLVDAGFRGGTGRAYYTRLHVRITPDAATDDLVLYSTGIRDQVQQRVIRYRNELEVDFPVCGQGWVTEDPGSCEQEAERRRRARSRLPAGGLQGLIVGVGVTVRRLRRV